MTNQYRLGNIIEWSGQPKQITSMWDHTISDIRGAKGLSVPLKGRFDKVLFFDDIKPIQLTHEWLENFGFSDDGVLETNNHIISIFYYDIWRLSIKGKPEHCPDDIYIEDYFDVHHFQNIIFDLTGKVLENIN